MEKLLIGILWYSIGLVVNIVIIKLIAFFDTSEYTDSQSRQYHDIIMWIIFLSWFGTIILSVAIVILSLSGVFSVDSKFYKWLLSQRKQKIKEN